MTRPRAMQKPVMSDHMLMSVDEMPGLALALSYPFRCSLNPSRQHKYRFLRNLDLTHHLVLK
jgi:hypothetical protein